MRKELLTVFIALLPYSAFAANVDTNGQIDIACGSAEGGYKVLKKNSTLLNPDNPANHISQPVLDAFNYVVGKYPSLISTTPSNNADSCKSRLTDELKARNQYQ